MLRHQQRDGPQLSNAPSDTSTWGKRLDIRAGLSDPLVGAPFGPFTPSPDILLRQRLVDVRAPTAAPSLTSRDVVCYIIAQQVYDNNPGITTALPQNQNPQAITPVANQRPAFQALFGRLTTSRGGVSSFEEFVIPAHGISLHIGSDTARVEVTFDPARAGIADQDPILDNRGRLAAGFSIVGGVATSGFYQDIIRQFYDLVNPVGNFDVPQFARRMQFFSDVPQSFDLEWRDFNGAALPNTPITPIPYVDGPQPIPVNASSMQIIQAVPGVLQSPVILWERSS